MAVPGFDQGCVCHISHPGKEPHSLSRRLRKQYLRWHVPQPQGQISNDGTAGLFDADLDRLLAGHQNDPYRLLSTTIEYLKRKAVLLEPLPANRDVWGSSEAVRGTDVAFRRQWPQAVWAPEAQRPLILRTADVNPCCRIPSLDRSLPLAVGSVPRQTRATCSCDTTTVVDSHRTHNQLPVVQVRCSMVLYQRSYISQSHGV